MAEKTMKPFHVTVLLAFTVLFFSCHNTPFSITEDFSYPLSVGNKWEYAYINKRINYKVAVNDSVFIPKDTILPYDSFNNFISVDRQDSITLQIKTFVLRDSLAGSGATNYAVAENWYKNNADGLYKYAYDSAAPHASPKAAVGVLYKFMGRMFSSPREICNIARDGFPAYSSKGLAKGMGIGIFPTPRLIYRYPYQAGAIWDVYNNIGERVRIAKQYLNKESITIPAGTFECYKVQGLWDWNYDGIWDTDLEEYEWISPTHGLVKRHLEVRDVVDISNMDSIGVIKAIARIDIVEEYTLVRADVR